MRKYLIPLLFLLVLVTPFALRTPYGTTTDQLAPNDALQLVIITSHVEGIRREFAEAFSRWHQEHFGKPVFVDYRLYGGSSDIVKYFQTSRENLFERQGTYRIDLVWGGGDYLFDVQLKRPGFLEPVTLSPQTMTHAFPNPDLGGIPLYDVKKGTWYGTALSSFGICYNKDVCRYLGTGEPRTWNNLTDPRYAGWLMMADPTRARRAGVVHDGCRAHHGRRQCRRAQRGRWMGRWDGPVAADCGKRARSRTAARPYPVSSATVTPPPP